MRPCFHPSSVFRLILLRIWGSADDMGIAHPPTDDHTDHISTIWSSHLTTALTAQKVRYWWNHILIDKCYIFDDIVRSESIRDVTSNCRIWSRTHQSLWHKQLVGCLVRQNKAKLRALFWTQTLKIHWGGSGWRESHNLAVIDHSIAFYFICPLYSPHTIYSITLPTQMVVFFANIFLL